MSFFWFSEGELFREVCRLKNGEAHWWWYRDILRNAEERGYLKITGHSEEMPFWWRTFEDSVEILSEKLKIAIKDDEVERVRK